MSDKNVKNVSPQSDFTSTPPTNRKVRNPFDKALIDKLHKPICSPSMCKIYKKESRGPFLWDIHQKCTLLPADIVACSSQFEPSPDPALDKIAEEATEKFFSQDMVMPSPLEFSKKVKTLMPHSTEKNISVEIKEKSVIMKDVSAQTVLSLPPELPPELENFLRPYFTYKQEHDMFGEYEISANGSLCRKLFFEDHSDIEHQSECDSEQTDEENHTDVRPPSSFEAHAPLVFSPDLSKDFVKKDMKRTFRTPVKEGPARSCKAFRNKILDVGDFGDCLSPIHFNTPPKRLDAQSGTSSSLASVSISPVNKVTSSDDEKANFTSPESEAMATCLDCVVSDSDPESRTKGQCFCKSTPNKTNLKRSKSLKDSPPRSRKSSFSFSEKRSLSLSSLHRSRSVQKLDFSMNMSVDESLHNHSQADSESSPPLMSSEAWSLVGESSIDRLVKVESRKEQFVNVQMSANKQNDIDKTPSKGKTKSSGRHEISKIRAPIVMSPMSMSLDNSLDISDNPLSLEDKKMDFNNIDLKFLTDNITKFDYTANVTKNGTDVSSTFKKVDSGFNENTFYTNASSYYESAIRPSELTITNSNSTALKEISNIRWARVDSGFKDETSIDNTQFYTNSEVAAKSKGFRFTEAKLEDKENLMTEEFSRYLAQPSTKNEVMSMSDVFPDDMTFTCKFSSTPSKSKPKNFTK